MCFERSICQAACKGRLTRTREVERQLQRLGQGLELIQPVLLGFAFLRTALETCLFAGVVRIPKGWRELAGRATPPCRIDLAHLIEQNSERRAVTDQGMRGE